MISTELGTLFREFRTRRNFTLKQAAIGLTSATVSRFEHEDTDISTVAAATLMSNIGMTSDDLFAPNIMLPDPYDALISNDIDGLSCHIDQYLTDHQSLTNTPLLDLLTITKQYLDGNAPDQLPLLVEQQLADILAYPKTWGPIEATIILVTAPFASHELCSLIWQRLLLEPLAVINAHFALIAFLALTITIKSDKPLRKQVQFDLNKMIADRSYRTYRTLPFFHVINAIITEQPVAPYIHSLVAEHCTELAHYLSVAATKTTATIEPWHNSHLIDRFDPQLDVDLNSPLLSGFNLGQIRRQRKLKIRDVAISWSRAAQSRFETDKSALSFSRTYQLVDALGLWMPSLPYFEDLSSDFKRTQAKVRALSVQMIQEGTSLSPVITLLNDYARDHASLPDDLLTLHKLALRKSATQIVFVRHDPAFPTATFSAEEQDMITNYVNRVKPLSAQDITNTLYLLGDIDESHIDSIVQALIQNVSPDTPAWRQLFERLNTLVQGPIYFRHEETVQQLADFFKDKHGNYYDWHVAHSLLMIKLAALIFTDPRSAKPLVNKFIEAESVLYPQATGYDDINWLRFAYDGDYHHFDV